MAIAARRTNRILLLAGLLLAAGLVLALFASRSRIAELWYVGSLDDPDPAVRREAARTLVVLRSERAVVPLFDAALREREGRREGELDPSGDGAPADRSFFEALVALGDCAVPELRFRLRSGTPGERSLAARVALGLGPRAVPLLDDLLRAARTDDSPAVRTLAIQALGDIGPDAAPALPYLRSLRDALSPSRDAAPPPPFHPDHAGLLRTILAGAIERIEADYD